MRLLFDIEANGLLDTVTQVQCLVAVDLDSEQEWVFRPTEIAQGIELIQTADVLVGHNICGYDIPVLAKLHKMRRPRRLGMVDTLAWSRASYPQMKVSDFVRVRRNKEYPKNLIGLHSLESWGHRLGRHKGNFDHKANPHFSEEKLAYCRNDVQLNKLLFWHLMKRGTCPYETAQWESEVAWIIARQERHGVRFDVKAAEALYSELAGERIALLEAARKVFTPWYVADGVTTPKRDNKKRGIGKGDAYTKVKLMEFNPASRDHIANRLQKLHGWVPEEFTPSGKPEVSDTILAALPYPECRVLSRYLMVEKRLGQLGDGKQAWLKQEKNGRLYGRVITVGARTQRMSHSNPNAAQVPSVKSPYGPECRALFCADLGSHVLVGADAAGCQLRMLGHYLSPFDGGAFGKQVVEGDPHVYLLEQSGAHCPEHDQSPVSTRLACDGCRQVQKRVSYAFLFGAGAWKLGVDVLGRSVAYGERVKKAMARRLSGGGKGLERALDEAFARKYVRLPDGRHAPTESRHDTLNTLLMGAEAVVMKRALVLADWAIQDDGLVPCEEHCDGKGDYEFVLNIHDEWQVTSELHLARRVGQCLVWGIEEAGRMFQLALPLKGDFKVGRNWAETH